MTQMPPSFPPQGIPPMQQAQPNPGGGLAVGALVLGILSIFVPFLGAMLGIAGLIMAVIAKNKKTLSKGLATAGLVLSIIGLVVQVAMATLMLPALSKARSYAKTSACMMNLSNMGRAIGMYKSNNEDKFPTSIKNLIDDGQSPQYFICPEDQITSGSSYFYCMPEHGDSDAKAIIACDMTPRHPNRNSGLFGSSTDSVNALCAGLFVVTFSSADFKKELAKPENARFAAEYAKAASMTPQQRLTYTPPPLNGTGGAVAPPGLEPY